MKADKQSQNVITLTIERETFLIPSGKSINEVLEVLSGLRRVNEGTYYYLEPTRRVLIDAGEAEVSVTASRREVITEAENASIKKADEEVRTKKYPKLEEEKEAKA